MANNRCGGSNITSDQNHTPQAVRVSPSSYKKLLQKLKGIQEQHCQEQKDLLSKFYEAKFHALVKKQTDAFNKTVKDDFLKLMEHLVSLGIFLDQNLEAHQRIRAVFVDAIQLSKDVMASRCTWFDLSRVHYLNRKEKMVALVSAIQAAVNVVSFPCDSEYRSALLASAVNLRREVEGPAIFRQEHRLACGLLGALAVVVGLVVIVASFAFAPIGGVSIFTFLAGMAVFCIGLAMLLHVAVPEADHDKTRKNENLHSSKAAKSLKNLATSSFTLFSSGNARGEEFSAENILMSSPLAPSPIRIS